MKPEVVILRHPGKLCAEARENIKHSIEGIFGEGVRCLVLCEGMRAWLLGNGQVYDLGNDGELVDGQFMSIAVEKLGPECNVEWKSITGLP